MNEKEDEFSIHVRAWGGGAIVWIIGFTTLLATENPWFAFLYLLLVPVGYTVITNEKARKSR